MKLLILLAVAAIAVVLTTPSARPVLANDRRCSDDEEGEIHGNLVVPGGKTCELEDAEVFGNVVVEPDGTLIVRDSRIRGNIQATDFDRVELREGSEVYGNVALVDGGSLEAEDADIYGNFEASGNRGGHSRLVKNRITGNLKLEKNRYDDEFKLEENQIGGSLQCFENDPAPDSDDDTAGKKEGQCAD